MKKVFMLAALVLGTTVMVNAQTAPAKDAKAAPAKEVKATKKADKKVKMEKKLTPAPAAETAKPAAPAKK